MKVIYALLSATCIVFMVGTFNEGNAAAVTTYWVGMAVFFAVLAEGTHIREKIDRLEKEIKKLR